VRSAIFLDRDGVLVEDVDRVTHPDEFRVLDGVPAALKRLRAAGFLLIMVSNQPIVARGLVTESVLDALNEALNGQLKATGGPGLDAIYVCPHHPHADVSAYRVACDCRKPRPGLLLSAAADHALDLAASVMVGDRQTDVAAGAAAGCRTVLVETGKHVDPPITTLEPLPPDLTPDHVCADLAAAADWVLGSER
jgi:D-glycero-D-manno-heptose 1,7-bisphosphate phosphatase